MNAPILTHAALSRTLEQALAMALPYEERYLAKVGKKAAVLALFAYPRGGSEPALLFIQRTEKVGTHKGQMAFPGGAFESGDASLAETARREAREELGLDPATYDVLGALPELWTVSGFLVTPHLAISRIPLEEHRIVPDTHEVAEVHWLPLREFFHAANFSQDSREYPPNSGSHYVIQVYRVSGAKVWGATGSIVKNLLDRLRTLS